MKKKAFKKMLAGVSAVAMLGSAMPMTLIADAYSYNNLPSLSTGFSNLFDYIEEQEDDVDSAISKSPLNVSDAAATEATMPSLDLSTYTYKLKKYETATVEATESPFVAANENYYATAWNAAAAKADLLEQLKDKDVTDVTFKNDGTIDTITINMPVTSDAIANTAQNVEYKAIKFQVIRTGAELISAYTNKSPSLDINLILADNITLTDVQTTHLNNNVNLNLNGKTLTTVFGYQVNNKTLRVWNGTLATRAGSSNDNDDNSTLTTYGNASIELYDGANITRLNTGSDAATISGAGKLVFAGEAVVSNDTAGAAIGIETVNNGDYTMYSDSIGGTEIAADDLKETTTVTVKSGKNHVYNQYGIEVTDRDVADSVILASTKYLDADLRTPAVKDYAYQPVAESTNGVLTISASAATATIDNIGKLYWLSQHVANTAAWNTVTSNTLTIEIGTDLDFSKAVEPFTPIDASGFQVTFNGHKKTISNMNIVAETGNAAIFSKTKDLSAGASKNVFTEIGLDSIKATAKESTGLVAALVAEGNSVNINKSFVINPTLTGTDAGAFASKLDKKSIMSQTYAASKYDMVFFVSDETTQNALLTKGATGTELTADGKTNFYVSDFTGLKMTGHGPTYFNGELKAADFKSGKAAFLLNKHEIKEVAAASVAEIADGTASANIGGTAYNTDIFGQTIGTNNYPVFATVTAPGKNIVYRQIEQTCKGENAAWLLTNAVFANTQVKMSASHKDADGDGICDVCTNAYKIDVIFDPCLHKSLKNLPTYTEDGFVRKADVNADLIENTVADLTAIDITLTDKYSTVESVLTALRATEAKNQIKGWDILTGVAASTNNNAGAAIANVNFEVKDSIICKTVTGDDLSETAFKIASNVDATIYKNIPEVTSTSDVAPVKNECVKTTVKPNSTKVDVYVVADNNVSAGTGAVDKNVSKNTATFTDGLGAAGAAKYTYQITFLGGVKHNIANDKKSNGTWNISATAATKISKSATLTDAGSEGITVYVKAKNDGTHSYAGAYCDCAIATEDCKATYAILNNKQHQGKCEVCAAGTLAYDNGAAYATAGKADNHHFEAMFTSGEFTVKRCRECGYVTFSKDTSIIAKATTIEKLADGDATFRQKYSFDIAAGDNTIVSYGVLYTKDGTPIDSAKIADGVNNYFDLTTGVVRTDKLGDVKYSSKKAIKTNGTYTASLTLDDPDADVNICGYVIYETAPSTYLLAKTDIITNNFRAIAEAEIENNCNISYEGKNSIVSNGVNRYQHVYYIDAEADFTIKQFGLIYSKAAGTPVTNDTTLADVNSTIKSTTQTHTSKSIAYRPTFATSETANTMRGYMIVEYKGITLPLYTNVNGNT